MSGSEGGPVIIGIAGGIGSGKSTVSRAFAEFGCLVYDADAEVTRVYGRAEVIETIRRWWGDRVAPGGVLQRAEVARIIFGSDQERERLQGYLYPLLAESRAGLVQRARAEGAPGVIIDAPMLFEAGLDRECDAVVFVDTPREERLRRVHARSGWDEAELTRRENAQLSVDAKRDRSDYTVDGSQSLAAIRDRVGEILSQIRRSKHGSSRIR